MDGFEKDPNDVRILVSLGLGLGGAAVQQTFGFVSLVFRLEFELEIRSIFSFY
jgi:hypothetical protein